MRIIDIREAKKNLSRLIDQAAQGQSFVIAKGGKPLVEVAKLAVAPSGQARRLGFMAARFHTPDDFDRMGEAAIERLFGPRR